jgi:hypothetical protein
VKVDESVETTDIYLNTKENNLWKMESFFTVGECGQREVVEPISDILQQ